LYAEVANVPFALLGAGIYFKRLVPGADHALCGMVALGKTQVELLHPAV
jgi:hypothetical protein